MLQFIDILTLILQIQDKFMTVGKYPNCRFVLELKTIKMLAKEINPGIRIKPLKLSVSDTPHLTIEPNNTCNIRCKACYNFYKGFVKSVDEVKKEIDIGIQKRKLDVITLLGGEPTIHPHLDEIIAYIKSKSLTCNILTNGVVLLNDHDGSFLERLKKAGVDRIILHVDSGQRHIHNDIEAVREKLFDKFEKANINFSLSVTVYPESSGQIPVIMKKYSKYKNFISILATIARDFRKDIDKNPVSGNNNDFFCEYKSISEKLNVEPASYIPSSVDDEFVCWLMYFYFINSETGEAFDISPLVSRMFRKIFYHINGRYMFSLKMKMSTFKALMILSSLIEISAHPRKISRFLELIKRSSFLNKIRFQNIVIQNAPEYNVRKRKAQICYHCPDATIRNGKLTPVCLADLLNPLEKYKEEGKASKEFYNAVYEHMEQL